MTREAAVQQTSEVEQTVLGRRWDTERHRPVTQPVGVDRSVAQRIVVRPATGVASVLPGWELPGLSVHTPEGGAPDSTVEGLGVEASREAGAAEVSPAAAGDLQEEAVEATGRTNNRYNVLRRQEGEAKNEQEINLLAVRSEYDLAPFFLPAGLGRRIFRIESAAGYYACVHCRKNQVW